MVAVITFLASTKTTTANSFLFISLFSSFLDHTMKTTVLKIEQKDTFATTYFKCGIADKWFCVSYLVDFCSVLFALFFRIGQLYLQLNRIPILFRFFFCIPFSLPFCVISFSFWNRWNTHTHTLTLLKMCVCVCGSKLWIAYFANNIIYILFTTSEHTKTIDQRVSVCVFASQTEEKNNKKKKTYK